MMLWWYETGIKLQRGTGSRELVPAGRLRRELVGLAAPGERRASGDVSGQLQLHKAQAPI